MKRRGLQIWFLGVLMLVAGQAAAVLEVTVTEGVTGAIPVAVAPFAWDGVGSPPEDVAQIVGANLARSGLFEVLPRQALPAAPESPDGFLAESWAAVGAEYLVIGRKRPEQGQILIEFHVFDVLANQRLGGFRIPVPPDMMRRGAHRVSDIVYEEITGDKGAFSARIAYVGVAGEGDQRRFTLEVADSDGANPRTLFRSSEPLMSPDWSPDGRDLVYVSFENRRSEVFRQNVETGARERIAAFKGINSAPVWSPDGRRIALTLSREGTANIYVLELASGELTPVVRSNAIDTEPAWSPDGDSLYFTSDRAGSPQVYQVRLPGGTPQRLTFEATSAGAPTVSPDGKSVVYVHAGDGGLRLARLDLDSRRVTLLTRGRYDKSPSFAPNGSMVIYSTTDRGRGILGSVSRDGQVHQRLAARSGEVREPAWSPL
ncbi:tolB protein precursor, periplasmic protein involved in the tonb-independent uptake of group A colicins [Thioalkalivibrio nitratireducens DSM 14787]|uniref:Tol-Pal system protein TolB n=1 Tax=Thioalkalivibrio nitratireducens (strain DSM 14787 / UNIQEM 213 / ALEN2) TaxID=1255043 RepID=L0E1C3_THIND|nr:Tol-Pal system beta propeller repeat protein TolB [Thioalkalivibrio nitratireducens]AGA35005.1 tolB protein precursor, periplasmic protein involved in the tonb-independent uptake of group A colicins [Thioalkalivibrio nitratireducens DSM 14787]